MGRARLLDEDDVPRVCLCLVVVPMLIEDSKPMGMKVRLCCCLVSEGGNVTAKDRTCVPLVLMLLHKPEEFVVRLAVHRDAGCVHDRLHTKKRRGSISNPGVRDSEVT